jgi:hypothetical protein
MLSVAPSQAAAGTPVVTATAGTASATLGAAETSTAARVSITGLTSTANDSYTVSVFRKSAPDSALADGAFHVVYLDTVTYSATRVDTDAQQAAYATTANAVDTVSYDSRAVGTANVYHFDAGTAAGYAGAKFGIMVDSGTNRTGSEGAYVFTVTVTPVSEGTAGTSVSTDVTLTINKSAAAAALRTAWEGSATALSTPGCRVPVFLRCARMRGGMAGMGASKPQGGCTGMAALLYSAAPLAARRAQALCRGAALAF